MHKDMHWPYVLHMCKNILTTKDDATKKGEALLVAVTGIPTLNM